MRYLLVLMLMFTGCATHITKVNHIIPVKQRRAPQHKTIDSILKYYFTDEAYDAVKDIKGVDGLTFGGSYVAGVNIWTTLYAISTGLGTEKKVVFSMRGLRNDGVYTIMHEYFHHIDDMTRDGDIDLVSLKEFKVAWKKYKKEFPDDAAYIDKFADKVLTNLFGIGELSEQMAYALQHTLRANAPSYIKHVYRKIIRNWK